MRFLEGKTVLVTGGAGSIGGKFVEKLLSFPVRTVRVFDSDEYGMFRLRRRLHDDRLRFLLGNILDRKRVQLALRDVNAVVHLAAVKNLEISEYNCPECIRVNVEGTINLVECSLETKPDKFLLGSSDKSVLFSSIYGATKFLSEKTVLWAHRIQDTTAFSVARFPNVIETRGNVFEVFEEQRKNGQPITVTHPKMRRFFINLNDAVDFLTKCLEKMEGGETFIPSNIQERAIMDIAKRYGGEIRVIGKRQGEKLAETLMTDQERRIARLEDDLWVIR